MTQTTTRTTDLGGGFRDHGVASPISNHRGIVSTVDGKGRNVALVWLFDHRGGYALLVVDAETGRSQEIPMPFPPGGDCPYASLLSGRNRFYTHFNSHFAEFDPAARAFTFFRATAPQMAMSMTEDDRGRIWSVTYPNSGVVCYDPATGAFRDYGHVYAQNWAQYQRSVAADDAGWIYFAVGNTSSQIIALDPETGAATPFLAESERGRGMAEVYRDEDGKVYGRPLAAEDAGWLECYRGECARIGQRIHRRPTPIITGSQGLFHREFADGSRLVRCDLVDRIVAVEGPAGKPAREAHFEYTSEGAHLMGLAAAPDGTLCGGTAFPMRFFSYSPRTDTWINRESYGQWNTVARQGDRFFVGGYTQGFLLEWDPARPWAPTMKGQPDSNPRFLTECEPDINRPHALLAHPDGRTVVLAGTPGYGYTGGGLLIWDRAAGTGTLLRHGDLLQNHSTMSLLPLPGRKILGGTTTRAGTGGESLASVAELYILDLDSRRIEWHEAVLPGEREYRDLCAGPRGLVYGIAGAAHFLVFDPAARRVVHDFPAEETLGSANWQQGARIFVTGPDGTVYILFCKGIARIEPDDHRITLLAESPVRVGPGGDILEGRIYFASGSHLISWDVAGGG